MTSSSPIGIAILAAGAGRRFGGGKQAAWLGGRPLISWAVGAALAADLGPVLVVVGEAGERVRRALPAHGRLVVRENPEHGQGMGTSLACAARWAIEEGLGVLVVALADQPLLRPETMAAVARACLEGAPAAAALAGERRTHPVALAARVLPQLTGLDGDQGARDLLARLGRQVVLVEARPESALDVDRPEDLQRARRALEADWAAPGPLGAALGLCLPQVVALAGSGGKTSLMYLLAAELARAGQPVVVTTTTRIYPPRAGQAGQTWLLGGGLPEDGELERRQARANPLCLAQGLDAQGKLVGLSQEQLKGLAWRRGLWVLVEADGAAGRPLKGWAGREPVWPEWTGRALVLAGASGLGRRLSPETVHRPERFAAASGLAMGEAVTPVALARALAAEAGPLRGLPPGASAALVLNQIETLSPEEAAEARDALMGLKGYDDLVLASLERGRTESQGKR